MQGGKVANRQAGKVAGRLVVGRQASRLVGWLADKHPNMETGKGTKKAKTIKISILVCARVVGRDGNLFRMQAAHPFIQHRGHR